MKTFSVKDNITGRIHSFETFGTLDGPGIRFVVFMQGCPFRCVYCHNRDTWDIRGGTEYTVGEVMEKLAHYLDYINLSGGGITATGGEPTLQPEFVTALFEECKRLGIHTALDTTGFTGPHKVERLLKFTDLVLLDLKHIDDEKHRQITGTCNEKIKDFARYLSEKGIPVWIRYVLIPGYTDAEEDLRRTAEFIRGLKNVKKVEVLPYHCMGRFKWEKLGLQYPLEDARPPSAEEVRRAKEILM